MGLIEADKLRERMYHDAFEMDSDMQKWDGGCWIRYKMFENAIDDAPTVDAVPVVRCKDCKNRNRYECDHFRLGETKCGVTDDWYCADGERREDEAD